MEKRGYEMDLRQCFKIIRKRIWIIALVTIISVAVGAILSYFVLQPEYETYTTLIVNKPNSHEPVIQYSDVLLSQKLVKTYGEIIKSRKISKKVIENLSLNITSQQLAQKITVTPVKDTEIVQIKVTDTNPKTAKEIANELADVFINDVKEIMKLDNVDVIDMAEVPTSPVKPRPKMNIIIAGFLGIMTGLGIVFLLEYLDNTIKSPEDIERYLDLNVIGTIPYIDKKKIKKAEKKLKV
ncbi:Wzz/FepE/Etk N-terminal domain-containing protein [Wukongibacter baidiensis]|uniref:YveK family protein n=1 Tax=Wukongibacter baidiensis TaxID=1723361 RepID=UPI003D7F3A73